MWRVAGESWREGSGRDGLVQRGTWEGSGVIFFFTSMSNGRCLGRGDRGSTEESPGGS
jgi:hypothetical protein